MTARTDTFRADLSGTAFGSAPTWTDLSAYVLAEGQGEPVSITWGRQDEEGDVTPSTMTIVLDNSDGRFTPDRTGSPYYPHVLPGFRANFRQTVNGTTYDRFDGYCDEIAQAWPGGSEGWSVVRLTFTDVTARLAKDQPLRSLLDYEMLADSPDYFYTLGEAAGATSTADISANAAAPATRRDAPAGARVLTFGQDARLADTTTGVNFGSANTGTTASTLSIAGRIPSAGAHSQEVWFVAPDAAPTSGLFALLWSSDYSKTVRVGLFVQAPDGTMAYLLDDGSNLAIPTSPASVCDGGPHQAVATLNADRRTTKLYLDGALIATYVAAAAMTFSGLVVNEIGGITIPSTGSSFTGVITRVAKYSSELSAARILAHYQAGIGAGPSERSDQRFSRIAGYGGITTSGLPTGVATMAGQRTAGRTALDCLKDVGRTEGSPVFADPTGALTFQARTFRYQAAATATLSASNHDVDPSLNPRKDRQGLINDITVTRDGGAAQRVTDSASQSAYGRADAGGYTVQSSTDDDALQNAQWQVATHKAPALRIPSLKVDLLSQPTTATTQAVLSLGISELVTLTGLPSNAPTTSMSFYVEGGRETIGLGTWEIEFYTSPVTLEDDVLVLDSGTEGILDTNVLGF